MIRADQVCTVEWVPIDRIVVDDAEIRSLDRVAFYRDLLRKADRPDDAPGLVVVWPRGDGYYVAIDGRHRWLAHLMEGRQRVRCLVVADP